MEEEYVIVKEGEWHIIFCETEETKRLLCYCKEKAAAELIVAAISGLLKLGKDLGFEK